VAAFDPEEGGIISMGGVGFDISCGVRALKTGMTRDEVAPRLEMLADHLFSRVPAGVGSEGLIKLSTSGIDEMLLGGAQWAIGKGYGFSAAVDVDDEEAADRILAVVGLGCSSKDENSFLALQVGAVCLQMFLADGRRIGLVDA